MTSLMCNFQHALLHRLDTAVERRPSVRPSDFPSVCHAPVLCHNS